MKAIIRVIVLMASVTMLSAAAAEGVAKNTLRIRATLASGITTVKVLITHPMETGFRTDRRTGEVIPAHYIERVSATWNGKRVFYAVPSIAVSKNPFFSFKFYGGSAGDVVEVSWVDNRGDSDSEMVTIR